jgi:hypothetical protein
MVFLRKDEKALLIDIIIFSFLQHQFRILTKIFSPKCFFK